MVVIAILGILVAFAVVRQSADRAPLEAQMRGVLAAIDLMSQQAIIHGTAHALERDRDGYRLREFRGGAWVDKQLYGVKSLQSLPEGVELHFDSGAPLAAEPQALVLLPSGETNGVAVRLVDARSGESALYETDAYGRYVVVR
jgi:hypothetical protein